MYKISVVVPVYNSEKTIERCIRSIQNQSYDNLEIVVVNDGSVDNTKGILEDLSCADKRIKLINIPNGGVSHARNTGIENATGDYITFVDSDDYIDKDMYSTLINIAEKNNVKIVHCSYKNVDNDKNILSIVGGNKRTIPQNHDEAMECLLNGHLFAGGMWNKLFSTELFEDVRLDETLKYNEDVLACFMLFDKVDSSVYIDEPFYNYVAMQTSSTHLANMVKYRKQSLYVSKKMQKLSKGKTYSKVADKRVASSLLDLFRAYIFSKQKGFTGEKKEVKAEILEYKKRGFYSSGKDKLSVLLFCHIPWLYKFVYKTYSLFVEKKLDPEQ